MLWLTYWKGLTSAEISELLSVDRSTVWRIRVNAIRRIRKELDRTGWSKADVLGLLHG